jgi:hypothetical protein
MLAPVFWIMPSPSQKRQVKMREQAMAMGFQIKIAPLPQTHRDSVRRVDEIPGVCYRLPWSNGRPLRNPFHHLMVRNETLLAPSMNNAQINELLTSALGRLPVTVVAIEYSNYGVAIYWREQGGLEALKLLYDELLKIRQAFETFHQAEISAE